MTKDTWAIISTIGGLIAVAAGVLISQNNQLNTRIEVLESNLNTRIEDLGSNISSRLEDLDGDVDNLRTDVRQLDERLRGVEIAFAKVDQRLLTLERAIIPAGEADDE